MTVHTGVELYLDPAMRGSVCMKSTPEHSAYRVIGVFTNNTELLFSRIIEEIKRLQCWGFGCVE